MAKVKIQFTEDQIRLIRNFRISKLDNKFYITPMNEKQSASQVNKRIYNITEDTDLGTVLVSQLNIQTNTDFDDSMYGIDTTNIWGGTFIYMDMAYILGLTDKVIPGTEEDPLGPSFEPDTMEYLSQTAEFIVDHIKDIEEILHQFCTEGIQAGVTYTRDNNSDIWSKQ